MNNKLENKKTKKLLFSNMLFRSWKLITSIFLNIFLWKHTNDIQLVAIFNIVWLLSYNIFYTLFARIIKFNYRKLVNFIAIFLVSISYLLLFLFWEKIIDYYIFFAILIWAWNWLYWIVYNNNEFDLTHSKNRWNYQWLKKTFKTIISIIVPSIIWIIIWINYMWFGYEIAFFLWLILFILSLFFWNIDIEYHKNEDNKFRLLKTLKIIFNEKELFKMILIFLLLWFALSNTLIEIILPLLLYSYWIKELQIWFLVSIFSLITIIASYLFWKFVSYKNYKLSVSLSGGIYIFLVIMLLFFPNYWFIILFSSILNLLFTFIDIPKSVYWANILEKVKNYKEIKTEYIVIAWLALSIWEILSFICIYFIWNIDVLWIKILFWIMAFIIFLVILLFNSLED